jgi:adenine-specific DNA-methyltransferase
MKELDVSRLTDLIAEAKSKNPQLGTDLEREFKVLSSRRAFGLNFERHRPEAVQLPQRVIHRGDKVRILPARGSSKKGDKRLWTVKKIRNVDGLRVATLELPANADTPAQDTPTTDLVAVVDFRDLIYPGLVSTEKVERGGTKPYHAVINGENYHALRALTYTHRGKVDAIYIDPPYNTRDKDWKYNNDYVDSDDHYKHSKWLRNVAALLSIRKS